MEPVRKDDLYIKDFDKIGNPDTIYLGDPKTVEAMVRLFLSDATQKRADVMTGKDSDDDLTGWLKNRIQRDVDVLLGRSNTAIPIGPEWNARGGGIVGQVAKRYGVSGSPDEIMAVPFYNLVDTLLKCEQLDAAGEDWEHLIDGDVETAVATFLGIDDQMLDL
jgi:hypothetical protein